jgi:hypothetical protein
MFYQNRGRKKWPKILAAYLLLFILSSTLFFTFRFRYYGAPARVSEISGLLQKKAFGCNSIYLRYRPDPYFLLREAYPGMEILEFIPGRLKFTREQRLASGLAGDPREKYGQINCFLLDENDSWEPELSTYLKENSEKYEQDRMEPGKPLGAVTLWRKKSGSPGKK